MKKYLLLFLFTFITTIAFTQKNYLDVVYLKEGEVVRGIIIDQTTDTAIKIQTAKDSYFVYEIDEIEKLAKEPIKWRYLIEQGYFKIDYTSKAYTERDFQDVVYLKDSSIIRGIITEKIPHKSIQIETKDKNIFVYNLEEIEKLTKEPKLSRLELQSCYKLIIDYGYGFGLYNENRAKLNIILGVLKIPYFSLGFGTGIHHNLNTTPNINGALVPFFADIRKYSKGEHISTYFGFRFGYAYSAINKKGLGFLLNPNIGISLKSKSRKSSINIGIGYEMQANYYFEQNNRMASEININLGVSLY